MKQESTGQSDAAEQITESAGRYSNIKAEKTVEIVNDLLARAENGEQIFFPIYTEEEVACILALMAASMVSGILMSRNIFTLWNLQEGIYYVRMVHLSCAYWNFLLLSVHIGLHWKSMMLAVCGRKRKQSGTVRKKYEKAIWSGLGIFIMLLGIRAFGVRKIGLQLIKR